MKHDFSWFLKILAVVCLTVGLILALNNISDYYQTNKLLALVYFLAGVFTGAFWWALAVIVKAAAKYLSDAENEEYAEYEESVE